MSINSAANIFDLNDALIIDPPHVRVERQAPQQAGDLAIYRKAFKDTGNSDYSIWTEYENQFFYFLAFKKLAHVAQLASLSRKGVAGKAPLTMHLETFDAGPDLQKWCRVQPHYTDGTVASHPFQHVAQYLQLMRACLTALKEIHRHDIVHGDIKEDNICLFYHPYPYHPDSGKPVEMDFAQLKLIDFAWSLSPHMPLEHLLPISGTSSVAYQAPMLRAALEEDRQAGKPIAVKRLDYRVDLYSLGHMAESIADTGLIIPRGAAGFSAFDGARQLGPRLKLLGNGDKLGTMPHDGLIAEIDGWLKELPGLEAYRFSLAGTASNTQAAGAPATPLAGSDDVDILAKPVSKARVRWKNVLMGVAFLAFAGDGALWLFEYHQQQAAIRIANALHNEQILTELSVAKAALAEMIVQKNAEIITNLDAPDAGDVAAGTSSASTSASAAEPEAAASASGNVLPDSQ